MPIDPAPSAESSFQLPAKKPARPRKRGAPKGNLNALQDGSSSKQFKAMMEELLAEPRFYRIIRALAERERKNKALGVSQDGRRWL